MIKCYSVSNIYFEDNWMFFSVDGIKYKVDLKTVSKALSKASIQQKQSYRILDGGYGITWFPSINEDLSIPALIKQAISHNQ